MSGDARRRSARPDGSRCGPHRHGSRPDAPQRWRPRSICCYRSAPDRSSRPTPAQHGSRRTEPHRERGCLAPPRTPPRSSARSVPDGDAQMVRSRPALCLFRAAALKLKNPNSDTVRLEGKHARNRYRARRLRALTSAVENTHALQWASIGLRNGIWMRIHQSYSCPRRPSLRTHNLVPRSRRDVSLRTTRSILAVPTGNCSAMLIVIVRLSQAVELHRPVWHPHSRRVFEASAT
jgi:hypothetical protein